MSRSYIPSKDSDIKDWAVNFDTVLTASPTDYSLTAPDALAVHTKVQAFVDAFALAGTVDRRAVNPGARTPVTVAALTTAKSDMLALIRFYAAPIIRNPNITADLKTALGVTVPDGTKTKIPAPTDQVLINVEVPGTGQQLIRLRASSTPTKKAKAAGSIGCVVFGATSAIVVADPATLPFLAFATRSEEVFDFNALDKGKTMYYAARWQNAKGQLGPWSAIAAMVIA